MTTQKSTKQSALDESELEKAKAEAWFMSIGDGAMVTDEHGRISRVNQVALDMLGFKHNELMGAWFPKKIIATNEKGVPTPLIERPITQIFITGETVSRRSYYEKKDGTLLPVSVTASPIILRGRPIGAIEIFRDITRELEIEMTKSEFISIASHQLRTPATAVKTYIGMLRGGYVGELTPKQKEFINIAYESNERQLHIVNDLLYVAKTESSTLLIKKEPTDLQKLVKLAVREHADVIKKRQQRLTLEVTKSPGKVNVDPSYFRMVVDNLISNASKYAPVGGSITIHISEDREGTTLSVQDTGVGIKKADMKKLFKKFTRIDNELSTEVGGSGIGLYLLKQIIDLHHATVTVKSAIGKGTVFTVNIPLEESISL